MISLCSIFCNSQGYLERYFDQVYALRKKYPDLRLSLGEGDSTDDTWEMLKTYVDPQDMLIRHHHGGLHYGSIDHPVRWDQIGQVVRPTLATAFAIKPKLVIWVESDIIWDVDTMSRLIENAKWGRAVAPMVFAAEDPARFYDTWGFRIGGHQFSPHLPYYPKEPTANDEGLYKIDSCGSCFVTSNLSALKEWDGLWPYRANGLLWLDPTVCVMHP